MQDATTLCQQCHGSTGTGASADVIDGVGYTDTSRGTQAGALRGGGFTQARIDSTAGVYKQSIGTTGAQASTSSHLIGIAGTEWGAGTSGTGASITLECTSCHDPHGNGNWRILKPVPGDDVGSTANNFTNVAVTSVAVATGTQGTDSKGNITIPFTYTFTTATQDFKTTTSLTYEKATGGAPAFVAFAPSSVTSTQVKYTATATGSTTVAPLPVVADGAVGGTLGYADPSGISYATSDGAGNYTYVAQNYHGLAVNQKVTITGLTPTGFNVTGKTITNVTSYGFTVLATDAASSLANTATSSTLGHIKGIPDSLGASGAPGAVGDYNKVYVTTNYWQPDDHYYTGTYVAGVAQTDRTTGVSLGNVKMLTNSGTAASGGPTAVIANISQWCTTCHTRLLTGSGSYKTDSGDATFMYMHRSNSGKENSPNCLTCHVAHGSNAQMSGTYSKNIEKTDPKLSGGLLQVGATGYQGPNSFMLRVTNRGTCNMCHNK